MTSVAPITPEFRTKAPMIMRDIMAVLPLSDEDAAAILGSFGVETGGFTLRQEAGKPNKDSTGYGWAQWTGMDPGERRLLFEQWCGGHGYSDVVASPDGVVESRYDGACYGYFVFEISQTWEKRVLETGGTISGVFYPPLKDCSTLDAKVESFWRLFERPGTPHADWRLEMAQEALRLYRSGAPAEKPAAPVQEPKPYPRIVISSGHGLKIRGASCPPPGLDEVNEARRVVDRVGDELEARGVEVTTYHDDVSTTQSENLNRITDFHNSIARDLDVSIHFNAYQKTEKAMGTECLYVTQDKLAKQIANAIASCRFINRGAKLRTDLHFLNQTAAPAILLEICFVDSTADADLYRAQFDAVCDAIADVLGGPEPKIEPRPSTKPEEV